MRTPSASFAAFLLLAVAGIARADTAVTRDGIVLTGSPSNVHPNRYGQAPSPEAVPYDEDRDATTLPLIRAALAQGLPLLAICRGFQELNVALGGTLHARIHELPGRTDHRRPQHEDLDVQYGPRHTVRFLAGGAFEAIAGSAEIEINSLHWQRQSYSRSGGRRRMTTLKKEPNSRPITNTPVRNRGVWVRRSVSI